MSEKACCEVAVLMGMAASGLMFGHIGNFCTETWKTLSGPDQIPGEDVIR